MESIRKGRTCYGRCSGGRRIETQWHWIRSSWDQFRLHRSKPVLSQMVRHVNVQMVHGKEVLAGQIHGCAWNALPNNVEHKVEAIMEPFWSPPERKYLLWVAFQWQDGGTMGEDRIGLRPSSCIIYGKVYGKVHGKEVLVGGIPVWGWKHCKHNGWRKIGSSWDQAAAQWQPVWILILLLLIICSIKVWVISATSDKCSCNTPSRP